MKFGKIPIDQAEDVPLAPLVNIVFLALIFFMLTTVYSNMESQLDLTLPNASTARAQDRTQGEIYVNIRPDGAVVVNEREVGLAELQDILNRVATYFPGGTVIVRGDRAASLGRAISVLDACKLAGIQNVSFAAVPPEETPKVK